MCAKRSTSAARPGARYSGSSKTWRASRVRIAVIQPTFSHQQLVSCRACRVLLLRPHSQDAGSSVSAPTGGDVQGAVGGEGMAAALGVPFLGRIPLDPALSRASEAGVAAFRSAPASPGAVALAAVVANLRAQLLPLRQSATVPEGEPARVAGAAIK